MVQAEVNVSGADIRAAILSADDVYREPLQVDVPWDLDGQKLYVRALTFGDLREWIRDGEVVVDGAVMPKMVVRGLVTEDGERIFKDADAKALDEKDHRLISALFNEVMRVAGLSTEGSEAVEADFDQARNGEPSTG